MIGFDWAVDIDEWEAVCQFRLESWLSCLVSLSSQSPKGRLFCVQPAAARTHISSDDAQSQDPRDPRLPLPLGLELIKPKLPFLFLVRKQKATLLPAAAGSACRPSFYRLQATKVSACHANDSGDSSESKANKRHGKQLDFQESFSTAQYSLHCRRFVVVRGVDRSIGITCQA